MKTISNMALSKVAGAVFAAATLLVAAAPAQAVITTFAEFSAIGTGANILWKNNGSNANNGTGGSIYTVASTGVGATTFNVPGSHNVKFSFLQASIAPYITDVTAKFTLFASVASTPAMLAGGFLIQPGIAGSFSFLTTTAMTVNGHDFAVGSNLLTGSFTQAAIIGARSGTSGSVSSSTGSGGTISYSSDFLSFAPTLERDFALSLTSITSALNAIPTTGTPTRALRTFKAVSTGSFSTDPAPIVTAVPEPAVWGLMIVGFGLVGVQSRRSRRNTVSA